MSDYRCSDNDLSKRDIPSFIEPRPPMIMNPFMRPRPQKATNLKDCFEGDSESDEAEWVQVYLRMKPYNGRTNLYEVRSDRCLITSVDTATAGHGRRTQHNVPKMYTFSHIFGPEANQKEIFEHVVKENLRKLVDGHNFTLLTYGASGSGKTYTLMGTVAAPGLVPRSLEYVFRVVDAAQQPLYKPVDGGAEKLGYAEQDYELQWVKRLRSISTPLQDKYRRMSAQLRNDLTQSTLDLTSRTRYYVWVSFVEIYNEGIYDLLSNSDRSKASSTLRIREDAAGNVYVKGVTQAFVRSGEEAYDVMVAGKHNLQVAATGVHAHSSRSHCIFTITMLTETESGVSTACVRLCDLAGSERAQRTHNTGARMQESRAINKSLHVLERCLHMLHRKQRLDTTLVPYRESKLTRLLGAGLTGLRGEAVSMVVTLNPNPEFVHETKHVLQLAVVAKDIQVNCTVAESSMETCTEIDTTMDSSMELMKLRAINERLQFELVQAQSCNEKLMAAEEEKRQEVGNTMREMVEEAKDMTRQYYEAQLETLRCEMEEMKEDYEQQISRLSVTLSTAHIEVLRKSDVRTPSKLLQMKDAQIAILEDQLAKAESEIHRLRGLFEENHARVERNQEEVVSVTDSESEDDPWNESLEPTVKKKDIIRYRLLQQTLMKNNLANSGPDTDDDDERVVKKSADTIKDVDESDDDTANSAYITGDNETIDLHDSVCVTDITKIEDRSEVDISEVDDQRKVIVQNYISDSSKIDDQVKKVTEISGIYAQNDVNLEAKESTKPKISSLIRGTYFVRDIETSSKVENHNENDFTNIDDQIEDDHDISKVVGENEAIEVAKESIKTNSLIRGTYFVTDNVTSENTREQETSIAKMRGTYFVKDTEISNVSNDSQTTYCSLLSEESIERNTEAKPDNIVNKRFKFQTQTESDVSLAQFEQLEKDSQINNKAELRTTEVFSNIKMLKEKRIYFDKNLKIDKEKKTDFDNMDTNIGVNKQVAKIRDMKFDDRSPSIVKECVPNNYEPSTIKKLLGERYTSEPDAISSMHKNVVIPKKHESFDIFEGFDSPQMTKPIENVFEPNLTKKEENANQIYTQMTTFSKKTIETALKSAELPDVSKITKNPKNVTEAAPTENVLEPNLIIKEENANQIDTEATKFSEKAIDTALKSLEVRDVSETITTPENITETALKTVEKLDEFIKTKNISVEKISLTNLVQTELSTDAKDKTKNYHRITENPVEYLLESAKEMDIEKSDSKISEKESYQKSHTKKTSDFKVKIKIERPSIVEDPVHGINVTQSHKNIKENNDFTQSPNTKENNVTQLRNTKENNDVAQSRNTKENNDVTQSRNTKENNDVTQSRNTKENNNVTQSRNTKENNDVTQSRNTKENNDVAQSRNTIENNDVTQSRNTKENNYVAQSRNTKENNDVTQSPITKENIDVSQSQNTKENNTIDEFETIYQDITAPRATEFDLLVSQEVSSFNITQKDIEKSKYNLRHNTSKNEQTQNVLLESQVKCESKPKRNLRLRRRKNQEEENAEENAAKLKDIVNLQTEFSDVTLDVPAAKKEVQDFPSPEEIAGHEENLPPLLGIQSCPAKSVTRSRRKLFTPRPEVLEESLAGTGTGDSNERVRVPRPSYHRATRARRKL